MAKFRQQSPPFQYSLSSPSLSRGPNPGSCFSSFSSRLQRFKELREGGREGRKDRREGGQRQIGKCRVEMHLRFFVREIRAEPPPHNSVVGATSALATRRRRRRGRIGCALFLVRSLERGSVFGSNSKNGRKSVGRGRQGQHVPPPRSVRIDSGLVAMTGTKWSSNEDMVS